VIHGVEDDIDRCMPGRAKTHPIFVANDLELIAGCHGRQISDNAGSPT